MNHPCASSLTHFRSSTLIRSLRLARRYLSSRNMATLHGRLRETSFRISRSQNRAPYKDYTCNLSHPIYESSLRAGHGWRESLDRHQRCLKLLDCGPLGRQAAGHPWSALRVVKSCRKDCPTASVLLEAKAAALHPERYQSSLSKLSTREVGEAGKRSEGNWIGQPIRSTEKWTDRQVEDREVETRSMSADTQA